MSAVSGIVLSLLAVAAFYYSLPRNGRTARFVGTDWEGYVVVAMICFFGLGLLLVVTGLAQAVK